MRTKSFLIALVAMMLPLLANAETKTFTQEGIKYGIEDVGPLVASVIGSDEDIENAVIPETIVVGNIEYTVTSISNRAFYNRKKLRSVVIPNTVTTIGSFAFSGEEYYYSDVVDYRETQLSSIRIGSGVKKIGYNAFIGCKNITDVYISDLKAWMEIEFEEGTFIEHYPREIGNPLQYASSLYLNNEKINHITVPDGISSIGKSFYKFKGLSSVTLGNSVTTIGEYAFSGCTYLSRINLGNSVTTIGEYAFSKCSSLSQIDLGNSVTTIGKYAFIGCTNIKSISIPNSVKYLEEGVFYGCKNMVSVTIGNGVVSIGSKAFLDCTTLSSVYISDIASWCKIVFYSNPLSTAKHLYLNNEEVIELIIPENVKSIPGSAFSGCASITSVTLPSSVTSIGGGAFKDCSNISSLSLENIVSIGGQSFANCTGLKKVTVGKSIKTISSKSFENCTALSDFTCLATEVPVAESGAFTNPGEITLHVPDGTVDTYKSYNPWASFKSIVPVASKFSLIYMVDGEVYKSYDIKSGSTIIPETEPSKDGYTFSGWSEIPEEMPAHDVTVTGTFAKDPLGKCALPTISIINGELVFGCETDDVEYHYDIKHLDVKSGEGNNVKLENTYRISVYASKDGYEDSDVTTKDFQFAVGKKGDIDGSGVVNAADVVQLTNIIMSGTE